MTERDDLKVRQLTQQGKTIDLEQAEVDVFELGDVVCLQLVLINDHFSRQRVLRLLLYLHILRLNGAMMRLLRAHGALAFATLDDLHLNMLPTERLGTLFPIAMIAYELHLLHLLFAWLSFAI